MSWKTGWSRECDSGHKVPCLASSSSRLWEQECQRGDCIAECLIHIMHNTVSYIQSSLVLQEGGGYLSGFCVFFTHHPWSRNARQSLRELCVSSAKWESLILCHLVKQFKCWQDEQRGYYCTQSHQQCNLASQCLLRSFLVDWISRFKCFLKMQCSGNGHPH